MIFASNYSLQFQPKPSINLFSHTQSPLIRQHPLWRRRRLKNLHRRRIFRNQFTPFDLTLSVDSFHTLVSQFPSVNSLALIAPALGFASGVAFYRSLFKSGNKSEVSDLGEGILFTTPTPFNRFVILRCPSISFRGNELLEDVNENLVKKDRHFVRLDCGRIPVRDVIEKESELEYQRVCVGTDDGGVICLDWPATLDLREEHGLDTAVLLVPGMTEGSMDKNIQSFVFECLKRGSFPVVMNPRGCAGSPLTTARLFTAADSDDINIAIQYINNARPWSTLMAVGWGYGANMLTKYLAEVGEKTPLSAATCIDNPFNLEEATSSSPCLNAIDRRLRGGLIDILERNKELFVGRTKGFDVEKAVLAKSVRDFEKAISMVSYGFDSIEDFYYKSGTQGVVGNVKIPVLFIQSDEGAVPKFSIPHSLIAENPYTSLLMCSSSHSRFLSDDISVISWCQHCTIEWLMAVELGLMKGRHPLLHDVDVIISPPKDLSFVAGGRSAKVGRANMSLDLAQPTVLNGYHVDPAKEMPGKGDNAKSLSGQYSRGDLEFEEEGLQRVNSGQMQQPNSTEQLLKSDEDGATDNERGQVLQTAEVVMNLLDATMPNTLAEEQKKKVLTAVSKGETLMKALQDAVPEDVRGKLTSAASGILSSQGKNLNFGLMDIGHLQNASSGSKSNVYEKTSNVSSKESLHKDPSVHDKRADNLGDDSEKSHPAMDQSSQLADSDFHTSEKSKESTNLNEAQSASGNGNNEVFKDNDPQCADPNEAGPVPGVMQEQNEEAQDSGMDGVDMKEDKNIQSSEEETSDPTDQKMIPSTKRDESVSSQGSSSVVTLQGNDNQERDEKVLEPVSNQSNSVPSDSHHPTFSVSQALDALTGMDDSTQIAVKNVFGVIEDMITHLEAENVTQNEHNETQKATNDHKLGMRGNNMNELSLRTEHQSFENQMESQMEVRNPVVEDKSNGTSYFHANTNSMDREQDETSTNIAGGTVIAESTGMCGHAERVPLYLGKNPFGETVNNDNFRRYPVTKLSNSKSLDINTTTALLLDYIPEDGQWKLSEPPRNAGGSNCDTDTISEPSYMMLDIVEKQKKLVRESKILQRIHEKDTVKDYELNDLLVLAKVMIMETLKVEVGRRLSAVVMKEMESDLARDMEQVANAVSLAVQHGKDHDSIHTKAASEKVDVLYLDHILKAISCAVRDTTCLRRVLPLGVIVGSSLAALKKVHIITSEDDSVRIKETLNPEVANNAAIETNGKVHEIEAIPLSSEEADKNSCLAESMDGEKAPSKNVKNDNVMVGAVTAALGASAIFAHQQDACKSNKIAGNSSKPIKENIYQYKGPISLEEAVSDENQSNTVTSFAEKAMSFAGPVVPTNEDGEVDQERLVAMLTEWGQKGGMLRLVGKLALLWGGLRGAMSLTDRLILFLRIADRPLFQRLLAFVGMVLVLWSPVVVPLLPTLMQGWATHKSFRFAELASIAGLYTAIMILVMLWGKKVRGYTHPFEQYGLDFAPSSKIQNFAKAFIGGAILVLLIQSVNALLGCVSLSWPSTLPYSSSISVAWFKAYGKILLMVGQGIVTATAVALVEELLFRSWLPAEIESELGYQRGIILSGLAFSLLQRSPEAVPGLFFLSLALAGARQRSGGSLSVPIGLRAGIMTVSFVIQMGGFLTYHPNLPFWVIGTRPFQPFSGVVGLAFSSILALVFYSRQHHLHSKKVSRIIGE